MMKNKKQVMVIISIVVLILGLVNTQLIYEASTGKLRSASICIDANGQYYGQHSSDNHWHRAVQHESGWYPDGGVVAGSPCTNELVETPLWIKVFSESIDDVEEVIDEKPVIKTNSKKITINYSVANDIYDKESIIALFGIEVIDAEDGEIHDINISPERINGTSIGENKIQILANDSQGNEVKEEVVLNIENDNKAPMINTNVGDESVQLHRYEIPKNIEELIALFDISIIDAEDGYINLTEENIVMTDNTIEITTNDELGVEAKETINYTIANTSILDCIYFIKSKFIYILVIIMIIFIIKKVRYNMKLSKIIKKYN